MGTPNTRARNIEKWMKTILEDGGIERFDDLHVYQIDRKWEPRRVWLDAALESFKIACNLRDRAELKVTVAAAMFLKSDGPRGVDFSSARGLERRIVSSTPPSLYLFHQGGEPWAIMKTRDTNRLFALAPDFMNKLFTDFSGARGFLNEWVDEDGWNRTFWLAK